MHIFDRKQVLRQKKRAAPHFAEHDFLLEEMLARTCERLSDMMRQFPQILSLGAPFGRIAAHLPTSSGVEKIIECHLGYTETANENQVIADEENLPFAPGSFDAIIAAGSLHWVNDLPGTLIQLERALKPDGLLLAVMPGGETLSELRQSLEAAEMALSGGISPRISPFLDIRDAGSLLQRAGFQLPVVDSEVLTISYAQPLKLLEDIRHMGEANALLSRRKNFTSRSVFTAAMAHYGAHFSNVEGRVDATIELITLTAWKKGEGQQKPARRGSGQVNLANALS